MTENRWSPLSAQEWDGAVLASGGHFLQSWRWGEFKSRFGWNVDRVSVTSGERVALAQILFKERGPVSVGYIPRGPVLPAGDGVLAAELMRNVDLASKRHHALYTMVEADGKMPFAGKYKEHGFVTGPEHVQPGRTVKIPLLDDDALLKQMRQNTRYSVRLAMRRGVQIIRCGEGYGIEDFYRVLIESSDRNDFGIHSRQYYQDFIETFGDDALCIFAVSDNNLAAGLIAVKFGPEAIYMYGASSAAHRSHGAAFLLQFEAMRWAREAGCARYDLWGIPDVDPESVSTEAGDEIAGTRGDDWRGLYRFKTGFGGEIVTYPPVLERRYSPVGSFVVRRMTRRRRGSDT
jgi:lipid II:glycine glycyltransferase (peptidoglycan interpeptide bridge formation enzyme)